MLNKFIHQTLQPEKDNDLHCIKGMQLKDSNFAKICSILLLIRGMPHRDSKSAILCSNLVLLYHQLSNKRQFCLQIQTDINPFIPVKSLKAVGTLLRCVTQNTSVFFVIYNPGSTISGLALWNLQ